MALYHFSYGANMDVNDLNHRGDRHRRSHVRFLAPTPATLKGFELVNNVYCPYRESGIFNIIPNPKGVVHGVLHKVPAGDILSARDLAEGKPNTFKLTTMMVTSGRGKDVEAGVLLAEIRGKSIFRLSESYFQLIIKAAERHKLPSAWIEHLKTFPRVPDFTTARRSAGESPVAKRKASSVD